MKLTRLVCSCRVMFAILAGTVRATHTMALVSASRTNIDERVRVFPIIVTATDLAGNSATDPCTAMVKPGVFSKGEVAVPVDLQQFLSTEHS
jgi:hypothetical protein